MAEFDFSNLSIQECIEAKALLDDRLEELGEGKSYKSLEQKAMVLRSVKENFASFLSQYGITLTSDKVSSEWVDAFKALLKKIVYPPYNYKNFNDNVIEKISAPIFGFYYGSFEKITMTSLTQIYGSFASYNMKLLEVDLPNVIDIVNERSGNLYPHYGAFESCRKLYKINMPKLKIIPYATFKYIGVDSNNEMHLSFPLVTTVGGRYDNNNIAYNDGAFESSKLVTVELPICVSIGANTFYSCTRLTNVSLPLVESVRTRAFHNCSALTSIDLPKCIEFEYGTSSTVQSYVTNMGQQFAGCTKLETVNVPALEVISYRAFYGCVKLNSFISNAKIIQPDAFFNCQDLIYFNFENIESIGKTSISSVSGGVFYLSGIIEINAPNLTELVGASNFRKCSNLKKINMPLITSLPSYTFYECLGLDLVSMPNVENLENYVFGKCSNLKGVKFDNLKTADLTGLFTDCTNLKLVVMPEFEQGTQTTSNLGWFQNCSSLEKLILPKMKKIGGSDTVGYQYFVRSCSNLKVLSLPMLEQTLTNNFIYSCPNLKIVDIGFHQTNTSQTAKSLNSVFYNSYTNLKHFIIRQTDGIVHFTGQSSYATACVYYVPDELVETYKTTVNWKNIPDRIKGLSEIPAEVLAELVPPTENDWLVLEEEIASEQTT